MQMAAADEHSDAFWSTVGMIELTDIAFAVDSILAAIALVGAAPTGATVHPKLWVVMVGGIAGVVMMRFAAVVFIRLPGAISAIRDVGVPAGADDRPQRCCWIGL